MRVLIILIVVLQVGCQLRAKKAGRSEAVDQGEKSGTEMIAIQSKKSQGEQGSAHSNAPPVKEKSKDRPQENAAVAEKQGVAAPKANPHGIDASLPWVNQWVIYSIKQLPRGGGYSVSRKALNGLKQGVRMDAAGKVLRVDSKVARPSFCSSATYMVLAKVTSELVKRDVKVSPAAQQKIAKIGLPDGVGVWGRWNANGPGTARLFAELECGNNFTSYDKALAGDFMKIWWTEEIGSKESGHSVVFLGNEKKDGVDMVRFWSSNIPDGYGEQLIERAKVKRVLFSRLVDPERLSGIEKLPGKDEFLADMLKRPADWKEVVRLCAVKETAEGKR